MYVRFVTGLLILRTLHLMTFDLVLTRDLKCKQIWEFPIFTVIREPVIPQGLGGMD